MDIRDEFPRTGPAYLNNASVSRMPRSAVRAMAEFVDEYDRVGPDSRAAADMVEDAARRVRRMVAGMLRCQPDEVSITQSTTDGINAVAGGMDAEPGSNIVMRDAPYEHHANVLPWLATGLHVRMLKTDPDGLFAPGDLEAALDGDTALVTLSHALYNTGAVLPLEGVGRMLHDVRFFVDAAQTVGNLGDYDYSRIRCDYMSFNGSKWLCGPMGTGLFYCSRRAAAKLRPVSVGGESAMMYDNDRVAFKDGPGRFEGGFRNHAGVAGLAAALEVVLEAGLDWIRRRNLEHTSMLREGLEDTSGVEVYGYAKDHIGVVPFNIDGMDPAVVVERLERRGVVMALREIGPLKTVRASPHFYNTPDEVELALDAVADMRTV